MDDFTLRSRDFLQRIPSSSIRTWSNRNGINPAPLLDGNRSTFFTLQHTQDLKVFFDFGEPKYVSSYTTVTTSNTEPYYWQLTGSNVYSGSISEAFPESQIIHRMHYNNEYFKYFPYAKFDMAPQVHRVTNPGYYRYLMLSVGQSGAKYNNNNRRIYDIAFNEYGAESTVLPGRLDDDCIHHTVQVKLERTYRRGRWYSSNRVRILALFRAPKSQQIRIFNLILLSIF